MLAYMPKEAILPGRTLQNNLEYYGISQKWLASHTGLTEKHISEIIRGEASITPATAVKFANVFGGSVQFWVNLEMNYRTMKAFLAQEERAKKETQYVKQIPYNDMVKAGWVSSTKVAVEKVINLYKFFGVSSLDDIAVTQAAAFRKSSKQVINEYAMAAWLRRGEVLALERADLPDYNKEALKESLLKIKKIIYEFPEDFFAQIVDVLGDCGVVLVAVKYLPKTFVNGATRWVGKHPVIQLSDRGRNDDQVWFTLFHEIGHILLHSKKEQFLSLDECDNSEQEREADEFATETLLPSDVFRDFAEKYFGRYAESVIKEFSDCEEISPSIVVGRLKHDKYIPWNKYNNMHKKLQVVSDVE